MIARLYDGGGHSECIKQLLYEHVLVSGAVPRVGGGTIGYFYENFKEIIIKRDAFIVE